MAEITLAELRKIKKICEDNQWHKYNGRIFHPKHSDLIDIITEFVARIDAENRPIIFELLKKYEIIDDYTLSANNLVKKFEKIIDLEKTYYLCPITKSENNYIKSGDNFVYDFKTKFPFRKYPNVKEPRSPFSNEILTSENSVVVFFDDFIGTGTQFKKCHKKFIETKGSLGKFMVIVIRIQKQAYDYIERLGVEVIAEGIQDSALSSGRAVGDLPIAVAKESYTKIEDLLQLNPDYSFGFKKAEAIITMKRTPNDTLPIFWAETDKEDNNWPAPFPRN